MLVSIGVGRQIARLARDVQPMSLMVVDRPSEAPYHEAPYPGLGSIEQPGLPSAEPAQVSAAREAASVPFEPAADNGWSSWGEAEVEEPAVLRFDHRPLRHVRTIRMRVTAYSPDERSCGIWADGFTASGYSVWTNGMCLVAADTSLLPFGTVVTVPGYHDGQPVPVLDRGAAIRGDRLDVLMPTHQQAMQWGVRWVDVDVWAYADE